MFISGTGKVRMLSVVPHYENNFPNGDEAAVTRNDCSEENSNMHFMSFDGNQFQKNQQNN